MGFPIIKIIVSRQAIKILLLLLAFAFLGYVESHFKFINLKGQNNLNRSISNVSSSSTVQPLPLEHNGISIQRRLAQANENWEKSNFRRDNPNSGHSYGPWDSYYPSFDCPYTKERVGSFGDGGKWICGMEELIKLKKCLVYSFGVKEDTSFEAEFAKRTNCTIRLFDPGVEKLPSIVDLFSGRVTFAKYALSTSETVGDSKSIASIMNYYNDSFIDVLKMDIEGGEWGAMNYTVNSFPQGLPFSQLAVEFHLNRVKESPLKLWKTLDKAGLRAFNMEPNMHTPRLFSEYSLINIKNGPFKMQVNRNRKTKRTI